VGDCLVSALQLEGLGWGKSKGSNQTPNTYCRKCWIIINYIYLDKLCYDLTSRPHVRSDVGGAAESGMFDDLCMLLSCLQMHLHLDLIFCSSQPCWMAYPKMAYPPKNVAPLNWNLICCIHAQLGPRMGNASVHQETYRWNGSDSDCPPVSSNMASWEMFKLNEGVHREIIYRWGSVAMFDCPRVSTFFHVAAFGGEHFTVPLPVYMLTCLVDSKFQLRPNGDRWRNYRSNTIPSCCISIVGFLTGLLKILNHRRSNKTGKLAGSWFRMFEHALLFHP